jgi:pimeloyl-ACP methyl ester carboxylesterase
MINCQVKKLNAQHFRLFLLLIIITAFALSSNAHAKEKYYPGELIDIGTHRLHINCIGTGSPAVIIDSGIGGFSLEWIRIQNSLADNLKVCSYDRAGYGWSDLGPRPRTTARISNELRLLLTAAKIPGPYLLVGHSFGGYNVRYFASKYPGLTAGLILVDSSHPEQFNTEEFKRVEKAQDENTYKNSYKVRIIHPIISDSYPAENKRVAFRLMSSMKSRSTLLNEMDNMEISARQVAKQTNHPPHIFPVTILTRGKRVWADDELGERREQQWLRLQNDLKNISMQSKHYLAKNSGHIIHLDQPEFVSRNIMSTALKVRAQIYEDNLRKKYDIRLADSIIVPSFRERSSPHAHSATIFNDSSLRQNPSNLVMFQTKFEYPDFNSYSYLH